MVAAPRFVDETTPEQFHLDLPDLNFDPTLLPRNTHLPPELATTHRISPDNLLRALARTTELSTPAKAENSPTNAEARLAIEQLLFALSPADFHSITPEEIKTVTTDNILAHLGPPGFPARYNSRSNSLTALYRDGSRQCASGTLMFGLTALRLPADVVRAQHLVLIYERGHVLPGYVRRKSNELHLIGLEMTVLGMGRKRYGRIANLASAGFALRILQAPEALALQAAGPFLRNRQAASRHVLERTAARYGIPLAGLENNIQRWTENDPKPATSPTSPIDSPWSFGIADVPPGNRKMMRREQLLTRNNHLSFSEVLSLLPEDATADNPENPYEPNNPDPNSTDDDDAGSQIAYPWDENYPGNKTDH